MGSAGLARLQGLFAVYKPPGLKWKHLRDTVELQLLKGLNAGKPPAPQQRVRFLLGPVEGSEEKELTLTATRVPSLIDHPLVIYIYIYIYIIQLYIYIYMYVYMYTFYFTFFNIMVYHRILNIVSCAIQRVFVRKVMSQLFNILSRLFFSAFCHEGGVISQPTSHLTATSYSCLPPLIPPKSDL
ncbi:hypothetical protein FD755_008633 [Muntiacus reevesi]|uniref:Uncharacterized protein n=1 Tax=Muntiacus reevesi TaxID=9886 RepID=A0A5J5ML85_MUNRE|nr:hypothetical protein FD755_008633 [Muntiacus reevesi]